jgi:hypothetical protein
MLLESIGKQGWIGRVFLVSTLYIDSSILAVATDTIDKV